MGKAYLLLRILAVHIAVSGLMKCFVIGDARLVSNPTAYILYGPVASNLRTT